MRRSCGIFVAALLLASVVAGCTDTSIVALNLGDVAVVTGDFDTPEGALDKMEVGYTLIAGWHENGPRYEGYDPEYAWEEIGPPVEEFLGDSVGMGEYDLVFLSCGMRGVGAHIYNDANQPDDQLVADLDVVENLRTFVELGGFVYATDWSYDLIEAAFPDAIEFLGEDTTLDAAQVGEPQTINGRVVDPDLRDHLSMTAATNEVEIIFRFDSWSVIESVGPDTQVLVEGDIVYKSGADHPELADSPLLVSFEYGNRHGKVIYTPFHTVAQITTDVQDIIDFLVLQLDRAEG